MLAHYFEEELLEKIDFSKTLFLKGDYENCTFSNCNLSETDISKTQFLECEFRNCNLSSAQIINSTFQECNFIDCKLLGLHFENCNPFGFSVYFINCQLAHSSFYQVKMAKTKFETCNLEEVDFTETILKDSYFDNCNLTKAIFENSNLENCDFRTARNYRIHPERNRIRSAKFTIKEISGLLESYQITIEK